MKRIAILTLYYKNYNYGGQLQAYALQHTIASFGHECKQISFVRNRKDVFWRKIRAIIKSSSIEKKKFFKNITTRNKISQQSDNKATKQAFEEWMLSIPHTDPIERKDMPVLNDSFDCFVVGSDQVWNTEFVPMTFFFDFVSNDKKKLAYAASIRLKKYERIEGAKIRRLLERFNYLSVREKQAMDVLRSIGVKDNIDINIDPTMLLDREEWGAIAKTIEIGCKYIFTYLIRNEYALSQIKEFAIQHDCKIVCLGSYGNQFLNDDVFMRLSCGIGPAEFIGLLKNAEYVFVESFHGTAFSIIFNKNFLVYGELDKDDRKRTILETFGLLDRCITYETSCEKFNFPGFSTDATRILEMKRAVSLAKLRENLSD